jgi:hypothetical protein
MAFGLLVMIVDRARGATRNGSNRRAGSTTRDRADSGAARRAYGHTPHRAADMVMPAINSSMMISMLGWRRVSLGRRARNKARY